MILPLLGLYNSVVCVCVDDVDSSDDDDNPYIPSPGKYILPADDYAIDRKFEMVSGCGRDGSLIVLWLVSLFLLFSLFLSFLFQGAIANMFYHPGKCILITIIAIT